MSWKEVSAMSQRAELVSLALAEGANVSALCARFGVSRKTAYKWIGRQREKLAADSSAEGSVSAGGAVFADRSRRPKSSLQRTEEAVEERVLKLRGEHPAWGGRKLRRRLLDLGQADVPAASTITAILRRHGLLNRDARAGKARAFQRFEHPHPNDLWQMDFKGHFAMTSSGRCHPWTVLDDHSRYSLGLRACGNELGATVQAELTAIFRQFGLPRRMLMDNGSPWGDSSQPWTKFTVWLIRLGISVSHGRPYHPQTQGKEERFHRSLKAEVLRGRSFSDLVDCQRAFDPWRNCYNTERPHESLSLAVPASRYRCSGRDFPTHLPAVEYASDVQIRKPRRNGEIHFQGRCVRVGGAFFGEPVGLRTTPADGVWEVLYCQQSLGRLDLREVARKEPGVLTLDRVTRQES
jgi:transposase InsO family protein